MKIIQKIKIKCEETKQTQIKFQINPIIFFVFLYNIVKVLFPFPIIYKFTRWWPMAINGIFLGGCIDSWCIRGASNIGGVVRSDVTAYESEKENKNKNKNNKKNK